MGQGDKVVGLKIFCYLCRRYNKTFKYVFIMNLRVFKKDIEYFVGEFIDDCALFVAINPHKDADAISQIVDEAVDLYNELKNKANHPEGNKKAFYTALTKEMFEKLDELCEKLSAVVSKA